MVDKIIILSWRVGTSKNKNIDHRVIETYKSDFSSLLCDSTMSSARSLCFLFHIRRNINGKKKNIYMWNQYYYYYFDLPKIRVGCARTKKKIRCVCLLQLLTEFNLRQRWTYATHIGLILFFWIPSLYSDQLLS